MVLHILTEQLEHLWLIRYFLITYSKSKKNGCSLSSSPVNLGIEYHSVPGAEQLSNHFLKDLEKIANLIV